MRSCRYDAANQQKSTQGSLKRVCDKTVLNSREKAEFQSSLCTRREPWIFELLAPISFPVSQAFEEVNNSSDWLYPEQLSLAASRIFFASSIESFCFLRPGFFFLFTQAWRTFSFRLFSLFHAFHGRVRKMSPRIWL